MEEFECICGKSFDKEWKRGNHIRACGGEPDHKPNVNPEVNPDVNTWITLEDAYKEAEAKETKIKLALAKLEGYNEVELGSGEIR